MARQSIDEVESSKRGRLHINDQKYATIGEVRETLKSLRHLQVIPVTGNGTLGRAIYLILERQGNARYFAGYINNPQGVEKIIDEAIKNGIYNEETTLEEIAKANEVEKQKKEKEEEEVKEKEEIEESREKDKEIQGKPADLEALVDEYEAYLEEFKGDVKKASAMMADRHGHWVREFVQKQQEFYQEDLKKLQEKGVERPEAMKLADKIAAEQVRVEATVKEQGLEGVAEASAEVVGEKIIEQVSQKGEVRIEEAVQEASAEVYKALNEVANQEGIKGEDKKKLISTAETVLAETTQDLLVDRKIDKIVDHLINQLPENNRREDNPTLTKIEAAQLESPKKREELKVVTKEAFKQAILEGDMSVGMIVSEVKKAAKVDLAGFGGIIENSLGQVSEVISQDPAAAATYVDHGVRNELVGQVLAQNPKMAVNEAAAFGNTVARVFSAKNNALNTFEVGNAVNQAKVTEQQREGKEERSAQQYRDAFWKISATTRITTMSAGEYQKLKENFGNISPNITNLESLSSRVRALKNSFDLFEKLDPRLNKLLKRLQTSNFGQKIPGVVSIAGIKRLEGGVSGLKKVGWIQKFFGTVQSPLGQAVFSIATNGLTIDTAGALVIGIMGRTGMKGALRFVGGRVVESTAGKAVIKGGTWVLGKLGIAVGLQAAPIVGQVATVVMFIPDLVNIIKKPLQVIGGLLDSLGINILGDMKKGLEDMGIKGLPGMLMAGMVGLGAAIVSIPALLGGVSLLPLAPILVGTLGGIQGFSLYQSTNLAARFTPGRPIGMGGAENAGTVGVGIGVTYFNGPIPPGCPSGWPINGPGIVYTGPHSIGTHQGSSAEAIDIDAAPMTPIVATHPGVAVCLVDTVDYNGGYGNYIDVIGGECKLTVNGVDQNRVFKTRYGHMAAFANKCGQAVNTGDVIGYMDSTGNSTGTHVHYEIVGGVLGDINQYLPKAIPVGCVNSNPFNMCNVSVP